MIANEDIRKLGLGRWTVPLLAVLSERRGARFSELTIALGIARDSLARTLGQAVESGWVMRNPGHGHPLRPEYVLTPAGEPAGAACVRIVATRRQAGFGPQHFPRWSLPIIGHLAHDWARFSDLESGLHPVTPRALSLNLQAMIGSAIVARRFEHGYPPSALYGLTPSGRTLADSLRAP